MGETTTNTNEQEDSPLLMFFGTECTHCHEMDPIVKQLEEENHVKVQRLEIWHDDKNMAIYKEVEKGNCGGVPFFYNKKSGKWICGSATLEKLKEWADS